MATVMLIDGNSLTYRAFFALPTDITLASGQVTNAAYGFTSMLLNLVKEHRPDSIGVAFDLPRADVPPRADRRPTRRNRAETPDLLREQMGLVRQVAGDRFEIPALDPPRLRGRRHHRHPRHPGPRRRADDVIDRHRRPRRLPCWSRTRTVTVLYNKRGVSDYANYDEAGILEKTGVTLALYSPVRRRCGATRPTTCPASPAWGEDGGRAQSPPTAASTASTSTSTSRRRSSRPAWPSTRHRSA